MQLTQVISAEPKNLPALRSLVRDTAEAMGADISAVDGLVQAVDECAANIILHGYRGQPGSIEVDVRAEEGALAIRLRDQAPLFDPSSVPPPDLSLPFEQRISGGLGIFLSRKFVDSFTYRVTEDGQNELTLRKVLRREG